MKLDRLTRGEKIVGISTILLFVLMFLPWFGVKATNTSNLLFAIQSVEPDKNAWEALECISIMLATTIGLVVVALALRVTSIARRWWAPINGLVAIAGLVSVFLILFRIVNPPTFGIEETVTYEGTVQLPLFLAVVAATGIAYGGYRALREGGVVGQGDEAR